MGSTGHVMSSPWWWEAVSRPVGKDFGRIEVLAADGQVIASMPYQLTRRGPLSAILMPELTQTARLWTAPSVDRQEALRLLIKELRTFMKRNRVVMVQVADYLSEADKELLRAEGFSLQDRVSYQIAATTPADSIAGNLAPNKRRRYKRACGNFTLHTDLTPTELYSALQKSYGTVRYPQALFLSLATAALANGNGVILSAQTPSGDTAAAVLLVTDDRTAYYLTPALHPDHKSDGANEWLTVQAIRHALSHGLTFDFEGSMVPTIAKSYSQYGSTPAHYTFATLFSPKPVKWLATAISALKKK